MFDFMRDDKTLTYILYAGGALILCIPIIHLIVRTIIQKREEEKERKLILKQIMEDRKKEKDKGKVLSASAAGKQEY